MGPHDCLGDYGVRRRHAVYRCLRAHGVFFRRDGLGELAETPPAATRRQ